jgi:uncharacterized phage protein (TIGR02218 family)
MSTYVETDISTHSGQVEELYRFIKGGTIYRFTSADHNVTVDLGDGDEIFLSVAISRSEPEQSKELAATKLTVTTARNNAVANLFKLFVPFVPVYLNVYRQHEGDTDFIVYWQGRVMSVNWDEENAILTCEPTLARMKRTGLNRLHAPSCQHALFSERCGVTKTNWQHTATITDISADGRTLTATEFDALADDYLTKGYIELASGDTRFIESHTGDEIVIAQPFGSALAETDEVTVYAGCRLRFQEDCIGKFGDDGGDRPYGDTGKFFGGFPTVPKDNIFTEGFE